MGNQRFRLSNIIPSSFRLSAGKSVTTESPKTQVSGQKQPQHCAKRGECISNKDIPPVPSLDEMLLLLSSSRSISTERLALCSETDHALSRPLLTHPHRPSLYKSSNSGDSPRRRKVNTSKCCHGVGLKQKSRGLNGLGNVRRSAGGSSSSSNSGFGSKKRKGLSETSVTVVKSSANPERDFKESMVEMIVENNVDGLEELQVSYLVLNSDEFHQVIVSVFKEIVIGLFTTPMNWIVCIF